MPELSPRLRALGATPADLAALPSPDTQLARVAKAMRKHCDVFTAEGEETVRVPKRVFRASPGAPVVGDWVAVSTAGDGTPRVMAVLPRRSTLSRRAAGRATQAQVVVANVDTAFVMVGLDGDYNLRRIERYLALSWQGGVAPVVLLNKSDLAADLAGTLAEVQGVAAGAPVHALSAKHDEGLSALAAYLEPARTIVVLGSSGVGKSTLVNRLVGAERMRTATVRERDQRGKHTTTHREIVPLAGGALLIDTPGMRELGLLDHEAGIAEAFVDVEELAAACRFGDCRHATEPGCAVRAALEAGTLDASRLASYQKLQSEVDEAQRRRDKAEREATNRAYAKLKRKRK